MKILRGAAFFRGVWGRGWKEEGTEPFFHPEPRLYSMRTHRAGVSGVKWPESLVRVGYSGLNSGDFSRPESPGLYRPESPVQILRKFRI